MYDCFTTLQLPPLAAQGGDMAVVCSTVRARQASWTTVSLARGHAAGSCNQTRPPWPLFVQPAAPWRPFRQLSASRQVSWRHVAPCLCQERSNCVI